MPNPAHRSLEEMAPLLVQVQRDLDEDLDLNTLARRFGHSPFHFHRRFKEVVGETPRQYVQRLRLEKAAYKLQITHASILDISLALQSPTAYYIPALGFKMPPLGATGRTAFGRRQIQTR